MVLISQAEGSAIRQSSETWTIDRCTHLPELLRGILARNALEDLGAAWVLIDEVGHVVDAVVDDDIEALVGRVVRGDVGGREGLGHVEGVFCDCVKLRGRKKIRTRRWGMTGDS